MTTKEKTDKEKSRLSSLLEANQVAELIVSGQGRNPPFKGINRKLLQIGGDATTGRGQVMLRVANSKEVNNAKSGTGTG